MYLGIQQIVSSFLSPNSETEKGFTPETLHDSKNLPVRYFHLTKFEFLREKITEN